MHRAFLLQPSPELATATTDALAEEGYDVRSFASAPELTVAALTSPPDLVIASASVPGSGAAELVVALRRDARTHGVPVVVLGAPTGTDAAAWPGCVGLEEPVSSETIRTAAVRAVSGRLAQPAAEEPRPEIVLLRTPQRLEHEPGADPVPPPPSTRELRLRSREPVAASGREHNAVAVRCPEDLFVEAAALVAETLRVGLVVVHQLEPGGGLAPRAATGFEHAVPDARAGDDAMAGLALRLRRPVVSSDLGCDQRFDPPAYLREAGALSGACVVIESASGPWGVLGAYSRTSRAFSPADVDLIRAVATLLAAAVDGLVAREALDQLEPESPAQVGARPGAQRLPAAGPHVARVAHDFTNLLQAIGGNVALLRERLGDAPELEEIARAVERGSLFTAQLTGGASEPGPLTQRALAS